MPIVSISKLQHRYGLSENLPQLSAAEIGWAIDSRRLYIGNGPVSEGAPEIGNTEILTEHSDILNISDIYEYVGEPAGYTHITGVDANNPVLRTLQNKLDDVVSVRDFGAKGDGTTDDTAAINRALFQLFCRESNTEIRRALYFPAGTYIVDTVKFPTYAKIIGDGKNSSIIRSKLDGSDAAFYLSDSRHQITVNIGLSGATLPSFIDFYDITLQRDTDGDVLQMNSASNINFSRVGFVGNQENPISVGLSFPSCVKIFSTAVNQSHNIYFDGCDFVNNNFGMVIDDDMQNITFNAGLVKNLFKGFKIGEITGSSSASTVGPRAVKITNSLFDDVHDSGIHVYQSSSVTSAFNYYRDVANAGFGVTNPFAPVIIFETGSNSSIHDIFDRTNTHALTQPKVASTSQNYITDPTDRTFHGKRKQSAGILQELNNNSSGSIIVARNVTAAEGVVISYRLTRFGENRTGIIKLGAKTDGTIEIAEDFATTLDDLGVDFDGSFVSNNINLTYTVSNDTDPAELYYTVEQIS